MEKKQQMQLFIKDKLKNLDQKIQKQQNEFQKLKLATLRCSFSKILETLISPCQQVCLSHYKLGILYLSSLRIQQCLTHLYQSKRCLPQSSPLSQKIQLLLIQCYLKNSKPQQALRIIQELQIKLDQNKEKYLELKMEIFRSLDKEIEMNKVAEELMHIVQLNYGKLSVQLGLVFVQIAKGYAHFTNYLQAIQYINQAIDILITKRYHNPAKVSKIYEQLARICAEIHDFDQQHSALICAYSMIKQLQQNQQKKSIEVLKKLSKNLNSRGQKVKALQYLLKIEQLEKKMYGQSGANLQSTVKKIICLLYELKRCGQARKYQTQYQHLIGCKQLTNLQQPQCNSQVKNNYQSRVKIN